MAEENQLELGTLNVGMLLTSGIIISVLTLLNIQGSARVIGLLAVLGFFAVSNLHTKVLILFFLVAFTADIQFTIIGIPYITILQMIFVISILWTESWRIEKNYFITICLLFGLQLYSVVVCDESIIRIITFLLNFLLLYCMSTIEVSNKYSNSIYITFILGMMVSLIAGIYRNGFGAESYSRFRGLWTDPNFLGMFCIIAIIFLYQIIKTNKSAVFITIPIFIFFAYCGYRTYSKTYIIAIVLTILLIIIDIMKLRSNGILKLGFIVIAVVALIYIYNNYISSIISLRGNIYTSGTDWTNGRFKDTAILLDRWNDKIGSILLGIGVNNSYFYAAVAHNTYAEIIGQFGIIGAAVLMMCGISTMNKRGISLKSIMNSSSMYIIVILIYALVLSLESTDLVYYLIGLSIAQGYNNTTTSIAEKGEET